MPYLGDIVIQQYKVEEVKYIYLQLYNNGVYMCIYTARQEK